MADASPAINHSRITVEAGGQTLVTVPNARSYLFRTVVRSDGKPVSVDVCLTPSGEMVDSFAPVWGGDMGMLPGRGFSQIFIRNREEFYSVTVEIETSPEYISTSRVSGSVQIVNGVTPGDESTEKPLIVQGDDFTQFNIPPTNTVTGGLLTESQWGYYGVNPQPGTYLYSGGKSCLNPYARGFDDDFPVYIQSRITYIASPAIEKDEKGQSTEFRLFPPIGRIIWIQSVYVITYAGDLAADVEVWNKRFGRISSNQSFQQAGIAIPINGANDNYAIIRVRGPIGVWDNPNTNFVLKTYFPEGTVRPV